MVFSFEPDIDLSIIIVNYNVKDLLRRCLSSIFGFQKDVNFEVMVIDNNSEDQSTKMVSGKFPQVKLLENKRNLGFSAACNQGIKKSRGRHILLLNPDTEFTAGGITKMVEFMDAHPQVGICGPRMIDPQGKVHFSCRSFPSYLTAISSDQSILNRLFPGNPLSRKYLLIKDQDQSQIKEVDWVSGSCLLTKREVFEKIGLLDELFFMYVEDVDFCYRAKNAGFSVYYFPNVEIVHYIGESTKKRRLWMQTEHHRSMYHFFRKHHHPNVVLKGIVFLSIWIRLWFAIWTSFFRNT
ncbi:MAG: glycosyltransferase family 2 protein [candidate division Zixibacteria bacterium]|nr:glycosyltransferase family 2 protein [candidate division Zixibacteria bacterium]